MLKQIRVIFSAIFVATLFVSTFTFSNKSAQACPMRIPSTMLSLYMQSDLVILADYENEKIIKRENENEDGFSATLERDLSISKIFKGNKEIKQVSYSAYEYRQHVTPTVNSNGVRETSFFGYERGINIEIGNQYLFFLRKDEDGTYSVTDNLGGIKNVEETLEVYVNSLEKLETIVQNKDNQLANITEWLVQGLEEPATHWDSMQDIYRSSNSLSYENNNPDEEEENTEPFVLDKTYNSYTSHIARNLNDSQKLRLSSMLSEEIRQSWFGQNPERVDYTLMRIVASWDKSRLATEAFSILQSVDETNFETKKLVMEFISNIAEDDILRNSYYKYSEIELNKQPKMQANNLAARNSEMQLFNNRFQVLLMQDFEHVAEEE